MAEQSEKTAHEGRNIKRIREILGIKQDDLATRIGLTQQAVSQLEAKESVDKDILGKISKALGVSVEAIKGFNEETAINIVANTVNNHDQSASVFYNPTFNPIEKIVELYERLLKSEQEKVAMLQTLLDKAS